MIDPRAMLLAAGCVLFGALILGELYAGAGDEVAVTEAAPAPRSADARTIPRAQPARLDDLLATSLARPLFSATRRPPETTQSDGPSTPDLTGRRLAGIVIEPDRRLAIFAVSGGKPLIVSEGESVNGWRIETIGPTEISLVGPTGTRTLQPKLEPSPVAQPRSPRGTAGPRPGAQPGQTAAAAPARSAVPTRPVGPAGAATAAQIPPAAPPPGAAPPQGVVRPGPRR